MSIGRETSAIPSSLLPSSSCQGVRRCRERERERERQREGDTQRQTERQRNRQTYRHTEEEKGSRVRGNTSSVIMPPPPSSIPSSISLSLI